MMDCTIFYEPEAGKIVQHIVPPLPPDYDGGEYSVLNTQGDASIVETHYVQGNAKQERPTMPLTGGDPVAVGELWRIDGIPAGTQVDYPGGSVVVDDGYIELSFAESGEYKFKFSNFPYLEEDRIATVTAI